MAGAKRVLFAVVVLCLNFTGVDCSAFEMVRSPDAPVKPGSTVSFTCSIRRSVNPSLAVLWVKRVGQLTYQIGVNQRMQAPFDQTRRYSATGVQIRTDRYLAVLTIKDVKMEDIGQIGCVVKNTATDTVYATLAVCDKPDNDVCRCVDKAGWAKPDCWEEPQSLVEAQAEFRRIIIGLAVCLAIAVIFGVVLVIIIGRDGVLRMKARREGNRPMVNQPTLPAYASSEQITANPDEMNLEIVPGSAVKNADPYAYRKNNLSTQNRVNTPNKANGGLRSNPDDSFNAPPRTPDSYQDGGRQRTPDPFNNGARPRTPDSYNDGPRQLTPDPFLNDSRSRPTTPQTYSNRASPHMPRTAQSYDNAGYNNPALSPRQQYPSNGEDEEGYAYVSNSGANV